MLSYISRRRQPLEQSLSRLLPLTSHASGGRLNDALRYAVFPGGKRMRPMLTLLGADAVGAPARQAMMAACAIEFLHTSSLILDDLPGMDDARLRRGREALHVVYGEGLAMLAALSLMNGAYALLARAAVRNGAAAIIEEMTALIGSDGMIGGQAADIDAPPGADPGSALATRNLKTTALMRLTMTAGAIACAAARDEINALDRYGEALGIAYQIRDDILDKLADRRETGTPSGQDARHLRATFVEALGLDGARARAASLTREAKAAITGKFGESEHGRLLVDAADFLIPADDGLASEKDKVA